MSSSHPVLQRTFALPRTPATEVLKRYAITAYIHQGLRHIPSRMLAQVFKGYDTPNHSLKPKKLARKMYKFYFKTHLSYIKNLTTKQVNKHYSRKILTLYLSLLATKIPNHVLLHSLILTGATPRYVAVLLSSTVGPSPLVTKREPASSHSTPAQNLWTGSRPQKGAISSGCATRGFILTEGTEPTQPPNSPLLLPPKPRHPS